MHSVSCRLGTDISGVGHLQTKDLCVCFNFFQIRCQEPKLFHNSKEPFFEGEGYLIKRQEAVAAVDNVGEDDKAAKIDFIAKAVRRDVVLLASVSADEKL